LPSKIQLPINRDGLEDSMYTRPKPVVFGVKASDHKKYQA